jgi:hypothetical protein
MTCARSPLSTQTMPLYYYAWTTPLWQEEDFTLEPSGRAVSGS